MSSLCEYFIEELFRWRKFVVVDDFWMEWSLELWKWVLVEVWVFATFSSFVAELFVAALYCFVAVDFDEGLDSNF